MKRLTLLFLIILLLQISAYSKIKSKGIPFITNYSKRTYEGGTQNWNIVQTANGLMYFANNEGVLEFDGNSWRSISVPNHSIVRSLAVDSLQRVYVGAYNEFGYLEPNEMGRMTYHSLTSYLPENMHDFGEIWQIFPMKKGVLFHSFQNTFFIKVKKFNRLNTMWNVILASELGIKYMCAKSIRGFRYWRGKLKMVPRGEFFKEVEVVSMLPFPGNRILISCSRKGLFLYDGTNIIPWEISSNANLMNDQIFTGVKIGDDNFAFGTVRNGIYIVNNDGVLVQHVNAEKGLQNNTVLSLFVDFDENLWVGLDNGIDYIETSSPLSLYKNRKDLGQGYAAIVYNKMLYLGTNMGLFCRSYDMGNSACEQQEFQLVENTSGQVWSLQEVGGELICGHNRGTYRIMGKTAQLICDVEGGWNYLYKEEFPNRMIGGTYNGLVLFERSPESKNKWRFVQRIKDFNESSREMIWDEDNSIWMCHGYKGVYRIFLNDSLDKVLKYRFYGKEDGFVSNLNINVQIIRDEKVFSSNNGFYRYVDELDRFEKHKYLNGLLGKKIRVDKMVENSMGDVWFFQGEKVGLLKLQMDNSFELLRKPFGRLSESFIRSFENVTLIDKENVLFGTEQGFVHYNSTIAKKYNSPFQVLIREFVVTNPMDSVLYFGSYDNSNKIQFSDEGDNLIRLPYHHNAIRFRFSAPFYEDPVSVKYQYQLEGFEETPSAWGNFLQKEYTNLPEGDYVFKVFAENEYGVQAKPDSFHFTILPPWYRSKLAYVIYFLLGMSGIAGTVFLIRWRMARIHENLRRKQDQELKLKEQKHREEALVAEREIVQLRNDKLSSEVDFKNRELASSTMNIIHKKEVLTYAQGELKNALKKIKDPTALVQVKKLIKTIDGEFNSEKDWEQFEMHFDQVHEDFLKKLRNDYKQLTPKDLRMCAYLRMNLATKEIAPLMNISVRGVEISRYRLRKKFGLSREENLTEFILKV